MVAGHAAVGGVNKVEAGLGLGTAVCFGLGEHKVEVRADSVGEGECGEAANVRFRAVEGL